MTAPGGKYPIADLVELKGCSVEEFILLASRKGISLPEGGDGALSLAEIKVIDPSLAYQLRYRKPERRTSAHESMNEEGFDMSSAHEEYSVLDKAGRLKLSDEIREQTGLNSSRVKIEVVDGKVVISSVNSDEED